MYIHIGQNYMIPEEKITGIFDLDNTTTFGKTMNFLSRTEKEGRLITVGEDLPKSFIVCGDEKKGVTVYLTSLSTSTILSRAELYERA